MGGEEAPAVITFLSGFEQMDVQLEAGTLADVKRTREIMETYLSRRPDFVDCCFMALSERLGIHPGVYHRFIGFPHLPPEAL